MTTNNQNLKKNSDKSFIVTASIPLSDIKKQENIILKQLSLHTNTPGFRPGKTPINLVKEQISQNKLFEEIASKLLSIAYEKIVKENNLHPVIEPKIKFLNKRVDLEHQWQVQFESSELPEIVLNSKYLNQIKKSKDKKPEKILEIVTQNSTVNLPEIIFKDYPLKEQKNIKKEWLINLAVFKIANNFKITVSQTQINTIISQNPKLSHNTNLIYNILIQQKVIHHLQNIK